MDMPWHVLLTISNAQTRKRHSNQQCINVFETCQRHVPTL